MNIQESAYRWTSENFNIRRTKNYINDVYTRIPDGDKKRTSVMIKRIPFDKRSGSSSLNIAVEFGLLSKENLQELLNGEGKDVFIQQFEEMIMDFIVFSSQWLNTYVGTEGTFYYGWNNDKTEWGIIYSRKSNKVKETIESK